MIMRQMRRDRQPINQPATAVRCRHWAAERTLPSVSARIAAFLDGTTNGEDLLHALYDDVLDEPIPESMREILQR